MTLRVPITGDIKNLAEEKLHLLVIGLLAALIALSSVHIIPMLRVAENLLYDLRIGYLSPRQEQSSEIVIVGITEETLSAFAYRSPIDRKFIGELLLRLEKNSVRAIGLDILIDQKTETHKDAFLRRTLSTLEVPIVAATANADSGLTQSQESFLDDFLTDVRKGSIAVIKDPFDGVVRNIPVRMSSNLPAESGFSARIAESVGIELPEEDVLAIDFKHGPDSRTSYFPIYPAHDIEWLPEVWFAGKIVLIGFELGFEDRHPTPLTRIHAHKNELSGVQIHAQALSQLLQERKIMIPGIGWEIALVILCAGLGVVLAQSKINLRIQVLIGLLLLMIIWVSSAVIFVNTNTVIKILPPNLALLFSFLVTALYQWRAEKSKRQFIHDAFSKYLSRPYVDQLVANPDQLRINGERREATFLFTDLAGFTPLTEKLPPEELVSLINEYLEKTCAIVTRHGGMVACVVGDALHVIFNAPVRQDDHAQRAIEAAIELDAFCREFEAQKASQGVQLGVTRIGINTGVTVIGNFGGEARMEYTAMGDAINTAARLEGANKYLGTRICVSETTVAQVRGIKFRPIGNLILEGKTDSTMIYEPIGASSPDASNYAAYLQAYEKMENRDPDAVEAFSKLSMQASRDSLVSFHLKRLRLGENGTTVVMDKK